MLKEIKTSLTFYGWFVVGACLFSTLTLGGSLYTFGIFFKSLENEFDWSRSLVSSGYTFFLIGFSISSIANGRLVDRYNPKPILFVNSILAGIGISLCGYIQTINQFRLSLFTGGLGIGATLTVPTSVVQRWFYGRERAGLALGIVVAGVGIGSLVFGPLTNSLILNHGWRRAYSIIGILFFILNGLSALVIKDNPKEAIIKTAKSDFSNSINTSDWSAYQVVFSVPFGAITLIHCAVLLAIQTMTVHLVPYAIDVGISPTAAAAAIGLLGGFSVPGRILAGLISDSIQWRRILALSCFGMALFVSWLFVLRGIWMLYCFVFFYGIFHGCRFSSHLGILGEFFGMESLGELIGISEAIGMFTGAFAPYMAGIIFDVTGSYLGAFTILVIMLSTSGIIASLIRKPIASN